MNRSHQHVAACLLLVLGFSISARAETIRFEAAVTDVDAGLENDFAVGDPLRGSFEILKSPIWELYLKGSNIIFHDFSFQWYDAGAIELVGENYSIFESSTVLDLGMFISQGLTPSRSQVPQSRRDKRWWDDGVEPRFTVPPFQIKSTDRWKSEWDHLLMNVPQVPLPLDATVWSTFPNYIGMEFRFAGINHIDFPFVETESGHIELPYEFVPSPFDMTGPFVGSMYFASTTGDELEVQFEITRMMLVPEPSSIVVLITIVGATVALQRKKLLKIRG